MVKTRGSTNAASKRKLDSSAGGSGDTNAENRLNEIKTTDSDRDDSDDSGNEEMDESCSAPPPTKSARKMRKKLKVETTPINYNLRFQDLGGLQDQIRIIHDSIIFRQENSVALKKSGLRHTVGGILLEGPPGTGKTLCAHTIAAELSRRTKKQYTFFTHNAVESFSKWMGDSEKTIRNIFRCAAECKPAIIFFDEFDSMCPRRDSDKGGGHSYKTIVGTLLAEFNNIQDNEIIVIATTNLKENIDPALLRNGRFDFFIHFPLPNEEQRLDILKIKMKDFFVQPEVLETLAKQTDGFSGSSLTFLCEEAKLNAFKRQKPTEDLRRKPLKSVDREDFLQVFRTVQLPKVMATSYADTLLDGTSRAIAKKLEPYIFREKDLAQRDGTLDSNCFLVWSDDSNAILNEKIIPKVLEQLRQRVYRITQDILDNFQVQHIVSNTKAFSSVLAQAKRSDQPCILLIENIDSLAVGLSSEDLYRALGFLGSCAIFVLATASKDPTSFPPALQLLFKPFGAEKAYKLPRPSEKEVYECFEYIFKRYLQPVLSKSPHQAKAKKLSTVKALVSEIMRMKDINSYEKMNVRRSELWNLCRISDPSTFVDNLYTLLQRQ